MTTPSNSVFINYRRDASAILVLAVYQHLSANQIDAFYDIESIKAGQFGEIILGQIAARPYFMPIFTPETLNRCSDPGDWVRREIEHALSLKRVLVPMYTPEFDFNDLERYLPHLASAIREFNRVELPTNKLQYFKYAMQDVVENYLKPITLNLVLPAPAATAEVERAKEALNAEPTVTEKQLTAQEYLNRALARSQRDLDGKIADYTEAIRLKPDYAEAYSKRGSARKANGDLDGAIQDCNEAIRLQPNYAEGYSARGIVRHEKGDLDGAIQDCNEAIRLQTDYALAYNNRGNIYYEKGDLNYALQDFTQAIVLQPDYALAYQNRGVARQKKGDYAGAAADYRRSLELNPNNPSERTMRPFIAKYGAK